MMAAPAPGLLIARVQAACGCAEEGVTSPRIDRASSVSVEALVETRYRWPVAAIPTATASPPSATSTAAGSPGIVTSEREDASLPLRGLRVRRR